MEPASPIRLRWLPRRRVALGLREHAAPALLFIVAGVALGPAVLNILSGDVLAQLDPLVSVSLAILGIFIASGFAAAQGPRHLVWLTGAVVETFVTLLIVGGAMYFLLLQWNLPAPVGPLTAAAILALSISASAAVRTDAAGSLEAVTAAHLADLDDLPIIAIGGVAVAMLAGVTPPLRAVGIVIAAGLVIGAAGALLFPRADTATERGVFVTGIVALLGGAAAYASGSPLVTGFVAGWLWTRRKGKTAALAAGDLRKLQHPLVAVLLIYAGASVQFGVPLLWMALPLVLFRLAGKLIGGLIIARIVGVPPGVLATMLLPPGALGIAVALNVQQVLPTGDTLLVSAVTVAMVASELLAVVILPREDLA
jgi:hypothetical protein